MKRRVLGFLASLLSSLALLGDSPGARAADLEAIIGALDIRQSQIGNIDVSVSYEERVHADSEKLRLARAEYSQYLGRFYGTELPPPKSAGKPLNPTDVFRLRRDSLGRKRIEMTSSDHLPVDGYPTFVFNGERWEVLTAPEGVGPSVVVSQDAAFPALEFVIGIGASDTLLSHAPDTPADSVRPWSELIRSAMASSNCVVNCPEELQQNGLAGVRIETTDSSSDSVRIVDIQFNPVLGMAPVSTQCTQFAESTTLGRYPEIFGATFVTQWDDFEELAPGVSLPQNCQVTTYVNTLTPKDRAAGFKPQVDANGDPVRRGESLLLDPHSGDVQRLGSHYSSYRVTSAPSDVPFDETLFDPVYEPGTIIDNKTTGEVVQIVGSSAAVDEAMTKFLESRSDEPPPAYYKWVILATLASLTLAVVVIAARLLRPSASGR